KPKKENVLFSNGCNKVKSSFPDGEWDSLAAEQRASDKEISSINKIDLSEPSFSANQDTNLENNFSQSSEFEDSIDYAFLNKTYSIHCSESKLKDENLPRLYSELHPEVHKKVETFFDILRSQDDTSFRLERSHEIPAGDCGDMQKSDVADDSQQEYHSAEQECISTHLPFDPAKTVSKSYLDISELKTSGYGIKCVGNLEANHVKLESVSSPSLESLNVSAQEYLPHSSKSQGSDTSKGYHQPKFEKCKEQGIGLLNRKAFDDIFQRSSSPLNPQKVPQTKMYATEMKSQTVESKDFCGNRIFQNKTLQCSESPISFPQDQALGTQLKANNPHQTTGASIFDDTVISLCGSSQYKSLPGSGFFSSELPKLAVTDTQAEVEDSCLRPVKSGAADKTCSHDVKEVCLKSVPDAPSCSFPVQPTLDASRGSNTRSSVLSTSSSTEMPVMRIQQADEWQREKQSIACNTDWSCRQDCRDEQTTVPKGPGRSLSMDSLKPIGNSLNENSLKLRKTFDATDRKKHLERAFQLCEEINLPSKCCEKTIERAVKAEMHLLDVCYQMCHRHCSHIYKLVMESKAGLNRNLPSNSAKKELGSTLLSVLGDLKVRYMNLKEKVHKGIPLEELPPLSVESKLLSAFSDFASRLRNVYLFSFSGTNSELDNQSVPDVDTSPSLKTTLSQVRIGEQVHRCRCVCMCVQPSGATCMCFCGGRVRGQVSQQACSSN
ncbi:RNA-binding protein 44, partial [Lemmus lemmus]